MGVDMIGNAEEAMFIHHWYHDLRGRNCDASRGRRITPEGWEYIGSGCYRLAYLSPSGVVYKVQSCLSGCCEQTNYGEWQTWQRLYIDCKMPRYSRLPKMGYYPTVEDREVGVIATEYIEGHFSSFAHFENEDGETIYWRDVCQEFARVSGVGDLHGANLMIDEKSNTLVPIDLGFTGED